MLESIEKAKQVGVIALERVGDYLDLFQIELDIQRHYLSSRIVAISIAAFSALLAMIFFGIAIIVSYWDTPYRIHAAWGIVGLFIAILIGGYLFSRKLHAPASSIAVIRRQLQEDIDLVKEIV